MTRPMAVFIVMIGVFIFSHGRPAAAQDFVPSYRPASPTLSPWLNLYQRNGAGGPLDPYHQFVRPELNLRDAIRQQGLINQRQNADVSALGQQMTQMEEDELAPIQPTGTGSVFMYYSHYYFTPGAASNISHAPLKTTARPARAWSPASAT
ncbi:MAG: hypothetical protein ABSG68_21260, partial [Thermoguttaceae bacterium]